MNEDKKNIEEMICSLVNRTATSLHIEYNIHKGYYQSLGEYLCDSYRNDEDIKCDFISKEDYQKCINEDVLWTVQCYKDTPIGFYKSYGSSLEIALLHMIEIYDECEGKTT